MTTRPLRSHHVQPALTVPMSFLSRVWNMRLFFTDTSSARLFASSTDTLNSNLRGKTSARWTWGERRGRVLLDLLLVEHGVDGLPPDVRLPPVDPRLIWEQVQADVGVGAVVAAAENVPAGADASLQARSFIQSSLLSLRLRTQVNCDVPAAVDQDDEFVPQSSVTHGQADLPEGALVCPDGPGGVTNSQRSKVRGYGQNPWWTHSGYEAPSVMSKRDEAMEFSDRRLCES